MASDHRSDRGLIDWRSPFKLYRDREPVGPLVSYWSGRPWAPEVVEDSGPGRAETSAVTPWATAVVADDDHDRAERTARTVRFLRLMQRRRKDRPAEEQDDEEFCAEMALHGVTPADVDWCTRGIWTIRTWDGQDHPMHSVDFIAGRTIRWQW
ncbi:hypothetical protein ACWDYH_24810 [Nocardia goodfellowii]